MRGPVVPLRLTRSSRAPGLLGRGEELGAALACLRTTRERGTGAMITFTGFSGLGLTAMLAETAVQARRKGYLVSLTGVPDPRTVQGVPVDARATNNPPFATLLAALRSGDEPVLGDQHFDELGTLLDRPPWLVERLARLLEERTASTPLLVAVDDIQWADAATTYALKTLPERLSRSPVVWALAGRVGQGPLDDIATTAETVLPVTAIALTPLPPRIVDELAQTQLGRPPGRSLRQVLDGGGGFPGLVVRLLETVVDAPGEPELLSRPAEELLPAEFVTCLRERLEADLDDEALQFLLVASTLRDFALADVAEVTGQSAHELLRPLTTLVDGGYLHDDGSRIGFTLELMRAAAYRSVPASARTLIHRTAISHLSRTGATPAEVSYHVVATARPGDADAVAVLREAARDLRVEAPSRAAGLLAFNLDLLADDDPARDALVVELATCLATAGRNREALDVAAGLREPPGRADHVVAAGPALWQLGRYDDLSRLAQEADPTAATKAIAAAAAAAAGGHVPQQGEQGIADAVVNEWNARRSALGGPTGDGEAVVCAAAGPTGDLEVDTDLLIRLDRLEAAEVLVRRARAITAADEDGVHAVAGVQAARLHLFGGRLDDAEQEARRGAALVDRDDRPRVLARSLAVQAEVAVLRGTCDEARSLCVATEELPIDRALREQLTLLELQALHGAGRTAEALTGVAALVARSGAGALSSDALVVCLRLARAGGDEVMLARMRAAVPTRANGRAGLHAQGLASGDPDALVRAESLVAGSGQPFLRAALADDLGTVLLELGRRDEGVAELSRAWRIYSETGAGSAAQRVQRRLRMVGVRRQRAAAAPPRATQGWDALTPAESTVALLVAQGMTNRQVADRLVVSPHTVATHLRAVYTKLTIGSRVQLTRQVMGRSSPT